MWRITRSGLTSPACKDRSTRTRGQVASHKPKTNTRCSATFIFAKGEQDEEFYRLDETIVQIAESMPGCLGEESWENPTAGLISNVYYWESLDALEQLERHPAHQDAKSKQSTWLNGYRVIISEVPRAHGDARLDALPPSIRAA
jgi:heme-degrading monooxygenase HmoA